MSIGDFATALLVASMCDTDTYKRVARKYAEHTFTTASPMYTTALLFSESLEAPASRRFGNWGVKPSELKETWKSHLAAIISNRVDGWDKIVLSLGDRLSEIGNIHEAHFCYMVCGYPISSPADPKTRIALLGCEHSDPSNRVLFTEEALAAFERTEAYEWAKRMGNRNAAIRSFQPYKLIYAMLLADLGQTEKSISFLDSIRLSSELRPSGPSEIRFVSLENLFDDTNALAIVCEEISRQLKSKFGPQVKYSRSFLKGENLEINISPNSSISRPSSSTENWSAESKVKTSKPKRMEGPSIVDQLSNHTNLHTPVPILQLNKEPLTALSDPDATFLSAKSNLMDITGYSMDGVVAHKAHERVAEANALAPVKEIPPETAVDSKLESPAPVSMMLTVNPPVVETRKTKKQVASGSVKSQPPEIMSTPQERRKPKASPATAPPVMMGEKAAKQHAAAPSSGGGGLGSSFKSWLIKKLNPDATECRLPEDNGGAYYDKERKRKSKTDFHSSLCSTAMSIPS